MGSIIRSGDYKLIKLHKTGDLELYNLAADIGETIELGVIDASFISITKILPPLFTLFYGNVTILALIKPQFELPKNQIGEGGVVRDASLHLEAVAKIEKFVTQCGMVPGGSIQSPILGPKGNKEFLFLITGKK